MGRKSKPKAVVAKPWCFYCDRTFDNDTVLIQHQKQRHWKCRSLPSKYMRLGKHMAPKACPHPSLPPCWVGYVVGDRVVSEPSLGQCWRAIPYSGWCCHR